MRMQRTGIQLFAGLLCLALILGSAVAQNAPDAPAKKAAKGKKRNASAEKGFVQLFDGKSLDGWEGDPAIWSVKDGVIVGKADKIKQNNFLRTKKEYGDFILRVQVRLVDNQGNTGVQFRSVRIPDTPMMSGFQADYANVAKYCGMLYDEKRRGILLQPTEEKIKESANKPGEWNDIEVRAEGDTIAISLNGVQTIEYTEKDPKIARAGLIGLQTHAGTVMEVQFKNVRIKELKKQ